MHIHCSLEIYIYIYICDVDVVCPFVVLLFKFKSAR